MSISGGFPGGNERTDQVATHQGGQVSLTLRRTEDVKNMEYPQTSFHP